MAKTTHHKSSSIVWLLIVSSYNVFLSSCTTVQLIHPDSYESPIFQHNLSTEERIQRLVSQTRLNENSVIGTSFASAQPQIEHQHFHYIMKIGIGTFKTKPPYKEYYLEIDTAGTLTWTQCQGCTKCFSQTRKPFPKDNSSSFHLVPDKNDPLTYDYQYVDGSRTKGVLAIETIHLRSDTGGMTKIKNFKIGCSSYSEMSYERYKNNKIAGIMALGWGDLSLVNQITPHSKGRFSYCLPTFSKKFPKTYLKFGDDVTYPRNSKSTPLYKVSESGSYYVELHGISVNRTRLNISRQVFSLKNNSTSGGCVIDSGMPYSKLISPAFGALRIELEKYFSRFKNLKQVKGDLGLEVCYERSKPEGFNNLPEVTLHLKGSNADFVLHPEAAFDVVKRLFSRKCLAMVRSDIKSYIGAHQQTNKRIIHDTINKQLVFHPEDCSKYQ